jgi:nucleoid-associated protein YgaU
MTLHLPIRGLSLLRPGVALFCLLAPLSLHSNLAAQDQNVAKAERQQQAQKSQQPATPHHVYTDEDLKRARILTPEDKKLAEAHRTELPARTPAAKKPPAVDATNPPPESLGEVARRYRKEKAARETEAAAAKKAPVPFRIELPSSTFAEPKPSMVPLLRPPSEPSVAAPVVVTPSPASPRRSAAPFRVSPFSPRPTAPPSASPAPSVNPSMLVPSREFQQLQVRPGDSLWRMARRYLGDGARWQELLTLNPGLAAHPDSLAAGSTVIVPAAAVSRTVRGSPSVITVQAGDTLWSLARLHLGRGSDWPRLVHTNPQLSDYLHLQIGSRLRLPSE